MTLLLGASVFSPVKWDSLVPSSWDYKEGGLMRSWEQGIHLVKVPELSEAERHGGI